MQEMNKRHSLTHMCRSVTSGNIQIKTNSTWDSSTFDPHLVFQTLSPHSRRRTCGRRWTRYWRRLRSSWRTCSRTKGRERRYDRWDWAHRRRHACLWAVMITASCVRGHRKRRQCSSCYRAGKKISHFQQWEVTKAYQVKERELGAQRHQNVFRFGVISTSCGYRSDLTCIQNNLRADSMKRLRLRRWPVRVAPVPHATVDTPAFCFSSLKLQQRKNKLGLQSGFEIFIKYQAADVGT